MNTPQLSPRHGAIDLKGEYNRNLGLALGISVGIHLALIGLYVLGRHTVELSRPPVARPDTTIWVVSTPPAAAPEKSGEMPEHPRPAVPEKGGGAAKAVRGGATLVPIDDSLITDGSIALARDIGNASPWGSDITGKGNDTGGLGKPIPLGEPVRARPEKPAASLDPEVFVAVEKEPTWDAAELRSRIRYPEIARRNDVQGVVVVRALIDGKGNVVGTLIDRSDNAILTDAAVEAVRGTRFTPAEQNGNAVALWIQIPVTFKLD